ncbi:sulfur oxidation c-type cytochrome SoxA [Rubrivivax sp. RP6-9]|uniref:sulfur oxidation c-type cytochrome SoxA n=1 Tax=Rubrivivax sp. RP6-9 TaxID=3415750 RepID=UPI003CC66667
MTRWLAWATPLALLVAGTLQAQPVQPSPDSRRSGFDFMSPATQALQRDDTLNPAALWLKDGEQRFQADCTRCHTAASMRGVAPRYPAFDPASQGALTLAGRINACRVRHAGQPALALESDGLLALEMFVANASRGMPIAPPADARLAPLLERGRQLYMQRLGQLDFSCAQCHDQHAGGRLAGSLIPQAHPTGYPIYRLEWQGVGSLQRRLRNCMSGVRAEPWTYGAPEYTALELYLMQRAAGMALETPGVRP